jgi:hypothetical protein
MRLFSRLCKHLWHGSVFAVSATVFGVIIQFAARHHSNRMAEAMVEVAVESKVAALAKMEEARYLRDAERFRTMGIDAMNARDHNAAIAYHECKRRKGRNC